MTYALQRSGVISNKGNWSMTSCSDGCLVAHVHKGRTPTHFANPKVMKTIVMIICLNMLCMFTYVNLTMVKIKQLFVAPEDCSRGLLWPPSPPP